MGRSNQTNIELPLSGIPSRLVRVSPERKTPAQVLEDILNQQQFAKTVKVFNFGASAYSVKQMAATLSHRMLNIQPDLVVMAIIPADLNLARTPIIDKARYLVDQKITVLLDSPVREVLRRVHLMYVLREIGLRGLFQSQNVATRLSNGKIPESYRYIQEFQETADRLGLLYLIELLPRMEENAWGSFPERLTQDGLTFLDLSALGMEFTKAQYMSSCFDRHPSPAVHHRIGESLADYIRNQGYLP